MDNKRASTFNIRVQEQLDHFSAKVEDDKDYVVTFDNVIFSTLDNKNDTKKYCESLLEKGEAEYLGDLKGKRDTNLVKLKEAETDVLAVQLADTLKTRSNEELKAILDSKRLSIEAIELEQKRRVMEASIRVLSAFIHHCKPPRSSVFSQDT